MTDVVTNASVDVEALRLERLARLQGAMRAHDVEVCLLSNEPNVRYATGASAMPVYAMSTFVRCAVVPQEGTPILFEHANSMHRSALRAPDVRPMHAWEFFDDPQTEADAWADVTLAAIRELGAGGSVVAVDRLGAPAYLALASRGVTIRDSAPVTQQARRVKTPQERSLLDLNGAMVMDMLAAFESAIAPGRERARAPRGPRGRDDPARWGVSRHEHGVRRAEHEPVAGRGDRSPARAR